MVNSNIFLESIKMRENFFPFWKGKSILFWWKDEVQNLIKYYLKNKWVKNYITNSNRFKINCVLADNWWGKSTLLKLLFITWNHDNFFEKYRDSEKINIEWLFWWNKYSFIQKNKNTKVRHMNKIWLNPGFTVLDDFFKLNPLINLSCNNDLLNHNDFNELFYNIKKNLADESFWKEYQNFLNYFLWYKLKGDYKLNISMSYINGMYEEEDNNIKDDINRIISFFNFLNKSNIFLEEEKAFIYIHHSLTILKAFTLWFHIKWSINNKDVFIEVIKKLLEIFWKLDYIFIWKYKETLQFFKEKIDYKNFEKILKLLLKRVELIKKWKYQSNSILNIKESNKLINICKESSLIFNQQYFKLEKRKINFKDTMWKEVLLSKFITLDLSIWDLKISNLSAWEKMMLIRFTNIYSEIIKQKYKWKTNFTILIDEPDLHLHLKWQQKYIQKLIDVFSTLDTDINLHFIIATHSPFIISDLPKESLVILKDWEQIVNKDIKQTFWANYVDIIKEWFFFEDKKLMWSFSEEIIWDIAEEKRVMTLLTWYWFDAESFNKDDSDDKRMVNLMLKRIGRKTISNLKCLNNILNEYIEENKITNIDSNSPLNLQIENKIGDNFIKDNLLYFVKDKDANN